MWRCFAMFTFVGFVLTLAGGEVQSQNPKKRGPRPKANDGKVANWSKPKHYNPKQFTSFWIWNENGIWHLRTTGGNNGPHQFVGRIDVIGGQFVRLKGKAGEYRGKNVDQYRFNAEMTTIAFNFKTGEFEDGLNFKVSPAATSVKFSLSLDGNADLQRIRVGKIGDHPASQVFTVPAHPVGR